MLRIFFLLKNKGKNYVEVAEPVKLLLSVVSMDWGHTQSEHIAVSSSLQDAVCSKLLFLPWSYENPSCKLSWHHLTNPVFSSAYFHSLALHRSLWWVPFPADPAHDVGGVRTQMEHKLVRETYYMLLSDLFSLVWHAMWMYHLNKVI